MKNEKWKMKNEKWKIKNENICQQYNRNNRNNHTIKNSLENERKCKIFRVSSDEYYVEYRIDRVKRIIMNN